MELNQEYIKELVLNQKKYFAKGDTLNLNFRIAQLKKLKAAIIKNQDALEKALYDDLGRCDSEAYILDIGDTIMEINEYIHGLKRWAKPETHYSGIVCFPSVTTKVYKMPYGTTLIIAPFNFPILLSLGVLAASICAGNTAIVKLSSKTENVTPLICKIIEETFDPNYVIALGGGHDVADFLLAESFDKIFYTGSPNVAKHVMSEASKNLTPVALELGGETGNWCVIRKDANLKDAARKIAFFKICNSGQICINVNQVAVAEEVADEFVKELKNAIIKQIGEKPLENKEYPHLIAKRAYEYCKEEAEEYKDRIIFGGHGNDDTWHFEPTIIYPVDINEKIVNHELFCPLLPIVKYKDFEINELMNVINSRERGLALYIFTKDVSWAKKEMQRQQFGCGAINEVCLQMMVKGVPFNGVGHSGMGAYHGIWGFKEFTHPSTVLIGKTHFNLNLREHPYVNKNGKKAKKSLFKKLMK